MNNLFAYKKRNHKRRLRISFLETNDYLLWDSRYGSLRSFLDDLLGPIDFPADEIVPSELEKRIIICYEK